MKTLRAIIKAFWADYTRNQRLYFLFLAGPSTLGAVLWLVHIVSDARWESPAQQLEILKAVVVILAFTHMVIVISMAAVRVSGKGPGGIAFDIDGDGHDEPQSVEAHVAGDVTITPKPSEADDGELPPDQRVKL